MDAQHVLEIMKEYASLSPWIVLGSLILAGFSVPISIDLLLMGIALFAATQAPHLAIPLYIAFLVGCSLAAWIAYWIARIIGNRLLSLPKVQKIISPEKLALVSHYFEKWGSLTLFAGRFIPFGIRSCIFWSCGLSKMPFLRFAFYDFIACALWSSLCFTLYYQLSYKIDLIMEHFKYGAVGVAILIKLFIALFVWRKIQARRAAASHDQSL